MRDIDGTTSAADRRLAVGAIGVLLAVALLGAACSKSDSQASQSTVKAAEVRSGEGLEPNDPPTDGGKVVMAVTAETNGWNPAIAQWADAGNFVGSSVLETLATFDDKGNIVPWLADSVQPATPGKFDAWRIKVKPNITFHNGEKLDAKLVKKNLDLYRSPNALSGIAQGDIIRDVVVIDDTTVETQLNRPWSAYPAALAGPSGYMMAAAQIDAPNNGLDKPIGTGPFVFDSWVRDSSFKAKKNPNYWRKGEPHLAEVEFKPIADAKQRIQSLQAGNVDMVLTTRADDVTAVGDQFNVIKDYNGEKTLVMLNTVGDPNKAVNPFTNVHARRALAYATNRDQIIQTLSPDVPLKSSTTPLVAGTKWEMSEGDTGYYPFDLAKAKDEVAKYKQETGATDMKFQFAGLSNLEDQQIMQLLQQQWKQAGIDCTIDTREQTAYITQLVLGGFQAAYFRNYAYIEPDSDWVFWHSSQAKGLGVLSINFQQYKDDALDKAIDHARTTDDQAARQADYVTATKRINDGAINIWLFNTPYAVIAAKNIRGLNQLRQQGFGNYLPKPWLWGSVWKQTN